MRLLSAPRCQPQRSLLLSPFLPALRPPPHAFACGPPPPLTRSSCDEPANPAVGARERRGGSDPRARWGGDQTSPRNPPLRGRGSGRHRPQGTATHLACRVGLSLLLLLLGWRCSTLTSSIHTERLESYTSDRARDRTVYYNQPPTDSRQTRITLSPPIDRLLLAKMSETNFRPCAAICRDFRVSA